jgi:hypothetical protein
VAAPIERPLRNRAVRPLRLPAVRSPAGRCCSNSREAQRWHPRFAVRRSAGSAAPSIQWFDVDGDAQRPASPPRGGVRLTSPSTTDSARLSRRAIRGDGLAVVARQLCDRRRDRCRRFARTHRRLRPSSHGHLNADGSR